MKRIVFVVAVLLTIIGLLPVGASAHRTDATKLRVVVLDGRTNCNFFCQGMIIDWSTGTTQVRVDFKVDTLDGSTASASEWGVEVYNTPCDSRRGNLIYTGQAIDHPRYGVRINEFFSPQLLTQIQEGSAVIFHNGPTPTQHADDLGFSGRHDLACIPIG